MTSKKDFNTSDARETANKNIIMNPLRAVETFKRKRVGQTAVPDNQSSSVTLNCTFLGITDISEKIYRC